mgnify:FL=1
MVWNSTHSARVASEQRYRDLFENIPICVLVINLADTPATILEVNHRANTFYGYRADELSGQPATVLVPDESQVQVRGVMQRVRRGETVRAEMLNRRRDGAVFPVRVIAALDPTNPARMIATVEDMRVQMQRRNDVEAIESERLRIAHEIHDGVAQNLAGLRFKSALWHYLGDGAPPEMRAALEEMQLVLAGAIEDIRRAIFALRPLDMESQGFLAALTHWVTGFGGQNGLDVLLSVSGEVESLPADYELPLFRVIQEGLNNIRQHAGAGTALVQLAVEPDGGVTLALRDNGRGFDPSHSNGQDPSRHFGLRQMRERISDLEGTLEIHSQPGAGTELLIRLPGDGHVAGGPSDGRP